MGQLYSLQEELSNISHQPNQHNADYFTKMKTIWDEIDHLNPLPTCTCIGWKCSLSKKIIKLQQEQRTMIFIMHDNDDFRQVCTNILMMEPLPTVSQADRLILQEQRHKELVKQASPLPDSMAFISDRTSSHSRYTKHQERPSTAGTKRSSHYFCDHCKMSGHSIERCFKIHGYPPPSKSGKRFAAVVQSNATDTTDSIEHAGLSHSQFNHLISLLGKHTNQPTDVHAPLSTTSPMACIFCLLSKHDSNG
ncbi:unnamed protein product [Amaranthus hypochondriacus]